jgi:MoxR-like ATPase
MIIEGSPGRGKTAVALAMLEAMGLEITRLTLSPTTTAEDLFGREMPQQADNGGFHTKFEPGPLTRALKRSDEAAVDPDQLTQAVVLDEINLSPPDSLGGVGSFHDECNQ